ncbi:MAG: hypothetical protein ACI4AH_03930 [Muribaculaceae bacterium]
MNKFLAKYFVATILPLIVCSCTLMLEEPPAPDATEPEESGDGITSPRTEINEFGKSTYQYNEGVRIIDESYLPYLVKAYKDEVRDTTLTKTFIILKKNTPADMIPQRGDLISTQNMPMIDFALCDQVDAVETEGNYFKVTSHVVALNKIFKVLEGEYIFDIVADGDSASAGTRSGQSSGGGAHLEGGYYRNLRTRATDEELLTGEKPMATIGISSAGKTSPQDIFKTLQDKKWSNPADISDNLKYIRTNFKTGEGCEYYYGLRVFSTARVNLSLLGIDVSMSNTFETALGVHGKQFSGSISTGAFATDASDVESDGFFPANSFKKSEYLNQFPDVLAIPITIGIPMTLTIGLSQISDMKFELESSDTFHFETSYTDENFKFGASDKESKVKKREDGVKHQTTEHDGTVKFKYGNRNTFEVAIGLALGYPGQDYVKKLMGTQTLKLTQKNLADIGVDSQFQLPSFKPLMIRILFTYKDINFSDNSAVSPPTIEYNGRTYKCGGNSWRDRSLSIGVGARFLQLTGFGGNVSDKVDEALAAYGSKDIQKAYDFLGKLRSILSTPTASGEIWSTSSAKYATFKYDIDTDEDIADIIYEVEVTPGVVDETHETGDFYANRCFTNLQLLVLDRNNQIIAVGEPSGTPPGNANKIVPEEKAYQSIYPKKDYEFKFVLNKRYAIEGIKLVPAYAEWYNPNNPGSYVGWSKTYMYDIPYQVFGENTAIKFNSPKGRHILNKPNFVGVLFDADFVLSEKDNNRRADSKIWIEVQGLDDKGEVIMKGTLCFDGQSKRAGTLKGLAYFPAEEVDSVKQITLIAKFSYLNYGIKTLQEIGRQTFDFPFVPNGESYTIDSKQYQNDGYAIGTVY